MLQLPPLLQRGRSCFWLLLVGILNCAELMYKMKLMEEKELAEQLLREGYAHLYAWEDGPNVEYPEHSHRAESAHIILRGEMIMMVNGETKTYRQGERFDLPADTRHSARTGPSGCRYLVGER